MDAFYFFLFFLGQDNTFYSNTVRNNFVWTGHLELEEVSQQPGNANLFKWSSADAQTLLWAKMSDKCESLIMIWLLKMVLQLTEWDITSFFTRAVWLSSLLNSTKERLHSLAQRVYIRCVEVKSLLRHYPETDSSLVSCLDAFSSFSFPSSHSWASAMTSTEA